MIPTQLSSHTEREGGGEEETSCPLLFCYKYALPQRPHSWWVGMQPSFRCLQWRGGLWELRYGDCHASTHCFTGFHLWIAPQFRFTHCLFPSFLMCGIQVHTVLRVPLQQCYVRSSCCLASSLYLNRTRASAYDCLPFCWKCAFSEERAGRSWATFLLPFFFLLPS